MQTSHWLWSINYYHERRKDQTLHWTKLDKSIIFNVTFKLFYWSTQFVPHPRQVPSFNFRFNDRADMIYRPQRSWGEVMFLHASLILFTWAWYTSMPCSRSPGGGWYPSMPCRSLGPHPRGKLSGLAWGVSRPTPAGVSRPTPRGSPGPHLRGLQAHKWGRLPACTEADPPHTHTPDGYCCGRYASYWNAYLLLLHSQERIKKFREGLANRLLRLSGSHLLL